ncbi:hypothetical protein DL769_004750 [Monosporascus sp. CRB-8-3]|nr:hypothetical protein DL769_004750 [Monosporascus sp. CRB-8-3]
MQSIIFILNVAFAVLAILANTGFAAAIPGTIGLRSDASDIEVAVDTTPNWENYSYTCTKDSIEVREEGGKWYMEASCPKMDRKTFLKSKLDLDNCYTSKSGMLFADDHGNFSGNCHDCKLLSYASGFPNEFTCVCDRLEQSADPVHLPREFLHEPLDVFSLATTRYSRWAKLEAEVFLTDVLRTKQYVKRKEHLQRSFDIRCVSLNESWDAPWTPDPGTFPDEDGRPDTWGMEPKDEQSLRSASPRSCIPPPSPPIVLQCAALTRTVATAQKVIKAAKHTWPAYVDFKNFTNPRTAVHLAAMYGRTEILSIQAENGRAINAVPGYRYMLFRPLRMPYATSTRCSVDPSGGRRAGGQEADEQAPEDNPEVHNPESQDPDDRAPAESGPETEYIAPHPLHLAAFTEMLDVSRSALECALEFRAAQNEFHLISDGVPVDIWPFSVRTCRAPSPSMCDDVLWGCTKLIFEEYPDAPHGYLRRCLNDAISGSTGKNLRTIGSFAEHDIGLTTFSNEDTNVRTYRQRQFIGRTALYCAAEPRLILLEIMSLFGEARGRRQLARPHGEKPASLARDRRHGSDVIKPFLEEEAEPAACDNEESFYNDLDRHGITQEEGQLLRDFEIRRSMDWTGGWTCTHNNLIVKLLAATIIWM